MVDILPGTIAFNLHLPTSLFQNELAGNPYLFYSESPVSTIYSLFLLFLIRMAGLHAIPLGQSRRFHISQDFSAWRMSIS